VKNRNILAQGFFKLTLFGVVLVLCGSANGAQDIISGVPDYQNSDFTGDNDCAPTASACVLGYWDSHGYDNLIDGSSDWAENPSGVTYLVNFLKTDMGWTAEGGVEIYPVDHVSIGIEATANDRLGYSFDATTDSRPVSWNDIITEVNADRPFVFTVFHPYYNEGGWWHSVAGVGYTEDEGGGSGPYYLNAIADSYVYQTEPGRNYGSQTSFFVGRWHDGGEFRAFVKFDLSPIDPGTPIGDATLRLHCATMSGSDDLAVYLVADSWSESTVTWNNKPGADLSVHTYHPPEGPVQTWEIDVSEHVRQWVDGTTTNHGFFLAGRYEPNDNWEAFSSKESSTESDRPELVVNAGWSDEVVIVHDNWTSPFPYEPEVWLNFNECGGPYLTWVVPGGGCGADSYEPDDTYAQASQIASGSPQNHSIVPATDVDWVSFSLSEESEVVIETSGSSGDTRMWLYDSSVTQLEYDDDDGAGNFSRIDRLCGVDALPAGTYYVKVDEYDNNDEICSYTIALTLTTCSGTPGQLQFCCADYTVRENAAIATIDVCRTGGSDGSVTVDYASSDGNALAEYDYLPCAGTLGFADGQTTKSFSVIIFDDDMIEDDETINLLLANPTGGATLGSQDTSMLAIVDNEPDLNRDGEVDLGDFTTLAAHWSYDCCEPDWCKGADFDSSLAVDFNDLAILCKHWLGLRYDILYSFNLDSSPGWSIEGEWAFGQPTGGGGTPNPNPDPDSGYTGNNVYGVNLNGNYDHTTIGGPYYLTAGPFDCNDCSYVSLKFARWLNTDEPEYVESKIEVSNNGTTWQTVWSHTEEKPGQSIEDNDWQIMEYDISAVADDQPTVYIRWSYEIEDEAYPYSGWNIDDIQLWGVH